MSLELAVGIISVALVIWWLLSPSSRLRKFAEKIPGPPTYPLVGNALNINVVGPNAFNDLLEVRKKYGPVFKLWLGPQLHVTLTDPHDIQMILSSSDLITKSKLYNNLSGWIGTGLLLSTGDLWFARRKAITPTFHFRILDEFVPIFNECANNLIDKLEDKSEKEVFDITPFVSYCALDAISKTAMGFDVQAQRKPKSTYVTSILEMSNLIAKKINYPWLGVEPVYSLTGQKNKEQHNLEILRHLPKKVLEERKIEYKSGDRVSAVSDEFGIKKRRAFLELLLDISRDNPAFKEDEAIMDEVTTFMFEGHDTTTSCLTFTIWALGEHPEIQEKAYNEVSSILENDENVKMEQLNQMKYLERVIKESLRMYPPVPTIGRYFSKDIALPSGYTIPAGTEVEIGIMLLHRDEQYFENPNVFDPDRFLKEFNHPYAYIPFSAGPRNCIGQKFAMADLKTILAKVILNFKIKSEGQLGIKQELILRTDKGANITLIRR
uniref:CytochromeP450 n=1 Tax=Riptortus pedestris TaxID=329032 RepID=R4WIC9_RIPPE|nr:cytochromeP450 [Riptortus pedestris]